MVAESTRAADTSDREIVSTRVFDVPREHIWRAWSEPDQLTQWWGPKGFTTTFKQFEMKPGGIWRFVMHGPDGKSYKNAIVYEEIVKPERIVYDHVSGPRFQVTATFVDEGGKTRVAFRMLFDSAAECEKVKAFAVDANEENFDRLEAQLARTA